MAKLRCPGCGGAYNGKRCRSCGYEPLREENSHRGTPPVTGEPARKGFSGAGQKPRNQHPILRFLVLLALINSLMPMFRNWGLELEAREETARSVALQPEPVLDPENAVIFHREDGITVFADLQQLARLGETFSLMVRNESDRPVTVSAGDIRINGIDQPHAALVVKAGSAEIGRGWLELNREEATDIGEIRSLSFTLTALGQDGRIRFTTDEIHITTEGANGP